MADQKKTDAQQAIFEEIARVAQDLKNVRNPSIEAPALKNLAIAYRLAAGGAQPGGSTLSD